MKDNIHSIKEAEKFIRKLNDKNISTMTTRHMTVTRMSIDIPISSKTPKLIARISVFYGVDNTPKFMALDNCNMFNEKYEPGEIINNIDEFYEDVKKYIESVN